MQGEKDKVLLVSMPPRSGKSIKYNRISKEKAFDICGRTLKPHKPPINPRNCMDDCYYFDGRCELGRTDNQMCVRYKNDVSFSNRVHRAILYDYEWCIKNFHLFCQLDKECFVAIYGKVKDGMIELSEANRDA